MLGGSVSLPGSLGGINDQHSLVGYRVSSGIVLDRDQPINNRKQFN
jgi:hypothetical protein